MRMILFCLCVFSSVAVAENKSYPYYGREPRDYRNSQERKERAEKEDINQFINTLPRDAEGNSLYGKDYPCKSPCWADYPYNGRRNPYSR
jgi:hypothetical protein